VRAAHGGTARLWTKTRFLVWSCAIQTIAEVSPPARVRATGTAALVAIASSVASSQVMARLFTLVFSIVWCVHTSVNAARTSAHATYRTAFFSQRAVSERCFGENCPAAARKYGWNSCAQYAA
jgi:hypothetical protein